MDTTDAVSARPMPQSRVPAALFVAVALALALRAVTGIVGHGAADSGKISWTPRERAGVLARAAGKPILYDFTAAWCGPCKMLDRDWEDAAIAARVNGFFVPSRIVDRTREDGRNAAEVDELLRRYDVSGFPTLVAADADGKLIGKLEGYRGRRALEDFLSKTGAK
jgi:thiol:disulfide interchange protein